jgi:phage terminase Nu1 subunit (DNA packaging protein)
MALVSVDKVAKALNVTVRRVNQLVHEGMPREDRGKYDLAQCMLWYIRYLQKALERREVPTDDGVGASLRVERQRLIRTQADHAELDLAVARAELVPIATYEQNVSRQIMAARQHFLTLPARIAPQLEGENRNIIRTRLDLAVRGALTAMAAEANNVAANTSGSTASTNGSERAPGGNVGAAADTEGKRVGRRKSNTSEGHK